MAILPTLSPQKSLDALKKQLEALQKIKGRTYIEAETDKTAWEHMTQSIIEASYGGVSSEPTRFDKARYQGVYNIRGISPQKQQANFDSQVSDLDGLLNALINVLRLQLPEEEIKGAYDAGDEYGFYRDLSAQFAAAKSKVFFIDAYLDEGLLADVKRKGDHVTIVIFGKMMKVALGAAEELQKEGISAEVIDLRIIRPFDVPTIVNSVKKTNRMVGVDECWPMASIASELAYRVQKDAFDYLDAPVVRINQADTPLPFSIPLMRPPCPTWPAW